MDKEFECENCGGNVYPVFFEEEEYKTEYGHMYKTGRVRRACSHLECDTCGKRYIVDGDYLAGEWHR